MRLNGTIYIGMKKKLLYIRKFTFVPGDSGVVQETELVEQKELEDPILLRGISALCKIEYLHGKIDITC